MAEPHRSPTRPDRSTCRSRTAAGQDRIRSLNHALKHEPHRGSSTRHDRHRTARRSPCPCPAAVLTTGSRISTDGTEPALSIKHANTPLRLTRHDRHRSTIRPPTTHRASGSRSRTARQARTGDQPISCRTLNCPALVSRPRHPAQRTRWPTAVHRSKAQHSRQGPRQQPDAAHLTPDIPHQQRPLQHLRRKHHPSHLRRHRKAAANGFDTRSSRPGSNPASRIRAVSRCDSLPYCWLGNCGVKPATTVPSTACTKCDSA